MTSSLKYYHRINNKNMDYKKHTINYFSLLISIIALGIALLHVEPFEAKAETYLGFFISAMGMIVTLSIAYDIFKIIQVDSKLKDFSDASTKMEIRFKKALSKQNQQLRQQRDQFKKQQKALNEAQARIDLFETEGLTASYLLIADNDHKSSKRSQRNNSYKKLCAAIRILLIHNKTVQASKLTGILIDHICYIDPHPEFGDNSNSVKNLKDDIVKTINDLISYTKDGGLLQEFNALLYAVDILFSYQNKIIKPEEGYLFDIVFNAYNEKNDIEGYRYSYE